MLDVFRASAVMRCGYARAGMAMVVLAALSACGSSQQAATGRRPTAHATQTRSYDPPGPPSDPWGPWIREASRRFDVPERWVREVMRQESGGRAGATSPVGAMGLMQVMPGTYRELQSRYDLGEDPYHPYDSIMAGTAYLREMYDLYGSPGFLAAYNAGPRRLENYLYNRGSLPQETRNYVARIGPNIIASSPVRRAPPEVYAAAEIPLRVPAGPRRMDSATLTALAEQRAIREQGAQYARAPDPEPSVAPVRMAAARPTPARGGVVAMEPIADGSTPGGAAALAESAARESGSYTGGSALAGYAPPTQTIIAGRMDPIPDGSTPEGAAAMAEAASRSEAQRPTQLADASPARTGFTRSLGFIGTAQASTLPSNIRPAVVTTHSSWAIQVGAFSDERQARSAAQSAGVSGGRVDVQPVRVGRATLFRARIIGLSQGGAQQACDRARGRSPCMVLSPDAQS
ncbi:hypothetical protein EOD42_22865 [Rhodovarius crocodyli]|uniref:Murein transglycosylase n=1 Tax=Rhodovarius crocodyli TaxID=1979269 RepID=A0A437M1N3_9PROT|nr:transglycosylase SLT domain-containing protein [Rhodovarius crocodyli]RVT91496.1 hypothetical protein EOD42_22865 [Rhodovarius crocodyli]